MAGRFVKLRNVQHSNPPRISAASRGLDCSDIDFLHRHHRLKGAFCRSAASRKRIGQRAWSDLPGEAPAVLAPAARAFPAAVADDRIPVAVRLCLVVRCDLEGERLAVPERGTTVETEAGNAEDGELHRQDIARLAARVIGRRLVDGGHFTARKGGGVEARRVKCVLVEPKADRVFRFHLRDSPWTTRSKPPPDLCFEGIAAATPRLFIVHMLSGCAKPGTHADSTIRNILHMVHTRNPLAPVESSCVIEWLVAVCPEPRFCCLTQSLRRGALSASGFTVPAARPLGR